MSAKPACGCRIVQEHGQSPRIHYCPMHGEGPVMWSTLETLEPMLIALSTNDSVRPDIQTLLKLTVQMTRQIAKDSKETP